MVEVRVDAMAECDLERVCGGKDRPIIVTNRPVRQGGACTAPEEGRLGVLRRAAELGADYVDVELDSAAALGALPGGTARIVSHHDLKGTPSDLEGLLRGIRQAGADVAKIAVTARDICDVPAVLSLLQRHAAEAPLIALAMGEEGVSSRILAGKFGAFLTYASLSGRRRLRPGPGALRPDAGPLPLPADRPGHARLRRRGQPGRPQHEPGHPQHGLRRARARRRLPALQGHRLRRLPGRLRTVRPDGPQRHHPAQGDDAGPDATRWTS